MPQYGRIVLGRTGRDVQVSIDGDPDRKVGGITLDWTTFAAAGTDTPFLDDNVLLAGQKGFQFGQILCKITSVVNGSTVGKYGPFDPAATDGRQTLTRGECFVANRSQFQFAPFGVTTEATDYPEAVDGGRMWKARLRVDFAAAGPSLVNGPARAAFEAAFPRIVTETQA